MKSYLKILLFVLAFVWILPHDTLRLSPVAASAAPHRFNILVWEVKHFPSKWWFLLLTKAFPYPRSDGRVRDQVNEYFDLQDRLGALQGQIKEAAASRSAELPRLERERERLLKEVGRLQPYVEEALEALITDELKREGIPFQFGDIVFPPVDIALDPLPTILITSPRDRIERRDSYLLDPRLPPSTRNAVEQEILSSENLSALVENLGGLSTYPAVVHSRDLRSTLIVGSHEWLHNYLFFHPLGQNYNRNPDMNSLNETAANIFGDELGRRIYHRLTGEAIPEPRPRGEPTPCPEDSFCFNREMRETRLKLDELLAQGNTEEAEAYMEQRRQEFVEHDFFIRKLNQAYFAFHGTYADSPTSVSPVNEQLRRLREASPSLGQFIHTLQGVSTYDQFLDLLDRRSSQENRSMYSTVRKTPLR